MRLHGVVPSRELCLKVCYLEIGLILIFAIVLVESVSLGKLHVALLLSRDQEVLHVPLEFEGIGLRVYIGLIYDSRGVLENVSCHSMHRHQSLVLRGITD